MKKLILIVVLVAIGYVGWKVWQNLDEGEKQKAREKARETVQTVKKVGGTVRETVVDKATEGAKRVLQ